MVSVDKIEQILAECKRDVLKTIAGNQAAGVRVRKAMQNIKTAANEVRDEVLNMRAKG